MFYATRTGRYKTKWENNDVWLRKWEKRKETENIVNDINQIFVRLEYILSRTFN